MNHLTRSESQGESIRRFDRRRQAFQQSSAGSLQRAFVIVDGCSGVLTRDQDQVETDWQIVTDVAEGFTHQAFEAASFDGVAVLLRDAQSAPSLTEIVPRSEDEQVIVAGSNLTVVDVAKLCGLAELR